MATRSAIEPMPADRQARQRRRGARRSRARPPERADAPALAGRASREAAAVLGQRHDNRSRAQGAAASARNGATSGASSRATSSNGAGRARSRLLDEPRSDSPRLTRECARAAAGRSSSASLVSRRDDRMRAGDVPPFRRRCRRRPRERVDSRRPPRRAARGRCRRRGLARGSASSAPAQSTFGRRRPVRRVGRFAGAGVDEDAPAHAARAPREAAQRCRRGRG